MMMERNHGQGGWEAIGGELGAVIMEAGEWVVMSLEMAKLSENERLGWATWRKCRGVV